MRQIIIIAILGLFSVSAYAQKSPAAASELSAEVVVYPNPCTEFIALDGNTASVSLIKVVNIVGKKVAEYNVSPETKYPVGKLQRGIYLVQLFDQNNKLIATRRLKKA